MTACKASSGFRSTFFICFICFPRATASKTSRAHMTHPPLDPPAPLELSTARQLSSLAEVSRALVDVAGAEKGVDGELEALLAARAGLERDLACLAEQTSEVRSDF